MSKKKQATIEVKGTEITVLSESSSDFISLTDIARFKNPERTDDLIRNWLRNRNTLEFLEIWEKLHNAVSKPVEFDGFRIQAGFNSFTLTPKQWTETTGAIGIQFKSGRYGGTFAHKDIAFEFAAWISVEFKLDGNMHDHTTIEQLIVLANIESMNAEFIHYRRIVGTVSPQSTRQGWVAIVRTLTAQSAAPYANGVPSFSLGLRSADRYPSRTSPDTIQPQRGCAPHGARPAPIDGTALRFDILCACPEGRPHCIRPTLGWRAQSRWDKNHGIIMAPLSYANGVPSSSPGLRGTRYPGSSPRKTFQPQRGCVPSVSSRALEEKRTETLTALDGFLTGLGYLK